MAGPIRRRSTTRTEVDVATEPDADVILMGQHHEHRLMTTVSCRFCTVRVRARGDDVVQLVRAADAVHDVLRPECPEAVKRRGD